MNELVELKGLTGNTRFGHSVTEATLMGEMITVPWEQGEWIFRADEVPIPGTLLIFDEETMEFVQKVDRFLVAKLRKFPCSFLYRNALQQGRHSRRL